MLQLEGGGGLDFAIIAMRGGGGIYGLERCMLLKLGILTNVTGW